MKQYNWYILVHVSECLRIKLRDSDTSTKESVVANEDVAFSHFFYSRTSWNLSFLFSSTDTQIIESEMRYRKLSTDAGELDNGWQWIWNHGKAKPFTLTQSQ